LQVAKDAFFLCHEMGKVLMFAMSISEPPQIVHLCTLGDLFHLKYLKTKLQPSYLQSQAKMIQNDFLCSMSYAARQHAQVAAMLAA